MIPGQACLLGNLIEVEWLLIALVDEGACATKPLVNFTSKFGVGLTHLARDFTLPRQKAEGINPQITQIPQIEKNQLRGALRLIFHVE